MNFADRRLWSGAARAVVDLLLPRACAACDRLLDAGDRRLVCGRCWARLHELPFPRCERCGHPLSRLECAWCAGLPPWVRAARSVCWIPGDTGGAIVHALKYAGWRALAPEMAARMARLTWPADVVRERTALLPVPLSRTRLRERGYNQSALLARALGAHWRLPVWEHCVERTRDTRTQTRLTPEERRHNVSGAFAVPQSQRARLPGTHLVLVDDVITTGATLSECAAALFDAGARIISIVTFGRAPAIGDQI
ncbi:MAG TPA: double zinc ribbon domain-containing protein [Gemmatimonadaceae bacterium]|jgi:ComF family protein|nr:double zinc ribbon domain-containing protein [Gemmatimonadaceae bacterium]